MTTKLTDERCRAGAKALGDEEIAALGALTAAWARQGPRLTRDFEFSDYWETMAFVNAVAWIAHREDHHPDLEVGYEHCRVTYSTHDAGGLTRNDFICAAKVDALLAAKS